jgi:hypothetical protein
MGRQLRLRLVVLGILLNVGCMAQMTVASIGVQANDDLYMEVWGNRASGQSEGPFHAVIYDDDSRTQAVGNLVGPHSSPDTRTPEANFLTFCVEKNNYFWSSGQYFNIDAIGAVTNTGSRTLTGYSAWVYDKFRALNISPTTVLTGTAPGNLPWATAMNDYQNGVWAGMVGSSGVVGGNDSEQPLANFTTSTTASPGSYADYYALGIGYEQFLNDNTWAAATNGSKLDNIGNYRVLVIQPRAEYGTAYPFGQDQVFFIGSAPGSDTVPEPTTLIIWSLLGGLGICIGWWRRKAA